MSFISLLDEVKEDYEQYYNWQLSEKERDV